MSADNGIYILKTTANHRRSNENGCEMWTRTDSPISVWRVAHVQGIDNLGWYLENEIYNLGFYLHSEFGDSPIFYSENEADSMLISYRPILAIPNMESVTLIFPIIASQQTRQRAILFLY